jgi:hypothetical protein
MIDRGLIRVIDYKDWIEGGFENEPGHVKLALRSLKFCMVKPQRFPEHWLVAPMEVFEAPGPHVHIGLHNGSPVTFDMKKGQELKKGQLPEISAFRLVLPKDCL